MTIEIETFEARLGERDYTIKTAGFIRSKPWKQKLIEEIKPLFEQIAGVQALKFNNPGDLLKLIPVMETIFLNSIEKVYELLLEYSPELEADREYIEAHATDKQILVAFQGAVKLADPFGVIAVILRQYGLQMSGT